MYCANCKTHHPDSHWECPICGNSCIDPNADAPKIKDGVTLKQVLDMKYDVEFRIMETINKEMREIRHEAGVPVSSINVDLVEITTLGFKTKEFAIRDVNLQLDLEGKEE